MKSIPTDLLKSLSNNDVTFFIPPYQRNYEWSTDNCKVLFSDVVKVARANESGTHTEHFFGSIVYVSEESGFGSAAKYVLTDGQQRITTTMLLLIALRDTIQDPKYQETIRSRYLQNDRADENVEFKIKLKQVETDWEAYKLLVLAHDLPSNLKNSSVYRNYMFFRKALEPFSDEERLSLLENGLNKFSIIAIQLEPDRNPWENPQEIFESMNSLGKPLSLADLVRNYLLMGKNSKQQEALYHEYWLTLEKRLPSRLSAFIRDWMQADQHKSFKVARDNNYKELYADFKAIVNGRTVEQLFESFVNFSRPYAMVSGLEQTGLNRLDQVILDLNVIGVDPAYSLLTELLSAWEADHLSNAEIIDILSGIRTYIMRRRVLGLAGPENKFFPTLGRRLHELFKSQEKQKTLFSLLSAQEYALRLPNDDEMAARLSALNFYNLGRSKVYPRLLLSMAEEHLTKSRPLWDDPSLQLEHIMPQKLNEDWRHMLGENFESVHQEFLNNLGNITLIRHNQELGNKAFSVKKKTYSGQSGLQVTQNRILDQETWNAEAISRRQDYLIELITQNVLEVPDEFKHGSNWNQQSQSSSQFDSRETLNQLIGEQIEFLSNPSITAEVISDSKVLFEGEEWSLGPLTKLLKERSGAKISKTSNFHGASNWSWDGVKLIDLEL